MRLKQVFPAAGEDVTAAGDDLVQSGMFRLVAAVKGVKLEFSLFPFGSSGCSFAFHTSGNRKKTAKVSARASCPMLGQVRLY